MKFLPGEFSDARIHRVSSPIPSAKAWINHSRLVQSLTLADWNSSFMNSYSPPLHHMSSGLSHVRPPFMQDYRHESHCRHGIPMVLIMKIREIEYSRNLKEVSHFEARCKWEQTHICFFLD